MPTNAKSPYLGKGIGSNAASRKNLRSPVAAAKGFDEYLETPTMQRRRAKAKRLAAEAEQLPNPAGRFAWLLDPARRRKGPPSIGIRKDPLKFMLEKVATGAAKQKKTVNVTIKVPNSLMLELVDLSAVSGLSLTNLIGGFTAMGIEGLYNQLEAAGTTVAELRKTHDTAQSLARFAYRPRRGAPAIASRKSPSDAAGPATTGKQPAAQANGNRPRSRLYPAQNN